jgi:uncharacterized iron-regulated protein
VTTTGAAFAAALFVSGAGAQRIDATDLYALPPADIVILGEVHDNPVHHAHQAIAIEAIAPEAIVFEMLTDSQATEVTPERLRSESALAAALGWEDAGWPDFAIYHPVFLAARDAAFVGGTESRDAARRAVNDGAAAVFGDDAADFGLDHTLPDDEARQRVEEQRAAHCDALPEDLLPGMVEAQRLRDAWLARAAIGALAEFGGPVVVITGNGHARTDWGVPALLAQSRPDLTVLSVGQYEDEAAADPPFDLWLVTEAADRPDPCAVFRQ